MNKNLVNLPQAVATIPTGPSLAGLKKALDTGNAPEKYPVGTEIPDTYNGQSSPWIVGHYGSAKSNGETKQGVFLYRKQIDLSLSFNSSASSLWSSSTIRGYLNSTYLDSCSDIIKSLISEVSMPTYQDLATFSDKFFLMSSVEVLGGIYNLSAGDGEPWESWRQRTGLSGSGSSGQNAGRVMYNSAGTSETWWLRDRGNRSSSSIAVLGGSYRPGSVNSSTSPNGRIYGVIPACFIAKGEQ